MRRNIVITIISVLILTCIFAYARTTTTDLELIKPTWDENLDILDDINANSDILEAFANDPLLDDAGERVEDRAGAMWTGNTETGITVTYQDADNTIDAVIGANDIVQSMLKCVNEPADEDIFTYESTTGDFEWHTLAELSIQPLDGTLTALAGLTISANSLIYGTGADAFSVLATNATATNKFLRAVSSGAPSWEVLEVGDIPDISATYQPLDTALTNISAFTYVSPSFIKLTADDTYAVRTIAETKSDLSLNLVENTALSTWAGTSNITTLGTITTGTWNATAIASDKIAAALTGKTYNGLTLTAAVTGFTIAGGTTPKTLTLDDNFVVSTQLSAIGANTAKVTESTSVTAPLVLTTYDISLPVATSIANGYLSSANWTTFNSKAASGANSDITSMTGITGSIGATGARVLKGWFTDLEVTNAIAGSVTGNAATVTNATLTTALTVNTGTLTLTANNANNSVLTIGAGAVSVSGSNTGDVSNTALTTGKLSQFATTTSAELAGGISDETGSGALVFGTSPTLNSPIINYKVTAKTTTATLNIAESGLISVSAAAGYTILLPTAVNNSGIMYILKKTDANTNLITIDGDGTETIDGALTYTDLNYRYAYVIIISDNANWLIIGESTIRGGTF